MKNSTTLNHDFVSAKEASGLSGYTAGYLTRLVRSGKLSGHQMGRGWLIELDSLNAFLKQQKKAKTKHSSLRGRKKEARPEPVSIPIVSIASVVPPLTAPQTLVFDVRPVLSHTLSVFVAVIVVASGAVLAQSPSFLGAVAALGTGVEDAAVGFRQAFDPIPEHFIAGVQGVATLAVAENELVQGAIAEHTAGVLPLSLTVPEFFDTSSVGMASVYAVSAEPVVAVSLNLPRSYAEFGGAIYGAATGAMTGYQQLISYAGEQTYVLATFAVEEFEKSPGRITKMNLALGQMVIDGAHAAIDLDVAIANAFATAAPASAEATFVTFSTVGSWVAGAAAEAPARVVTAFLQITEAPSHAAPALASAVWGVEYEAALRFVSATDALSESYLALVERAGESVYAGTEATASIASALPGVSQVAIVFSSGAW